MEIVVGDVTVAGLADLARVSIAFTVDRVLDVGATQGGTGGFVLTERRLTAPYLKNYDALDEGPGRWAARFDVSDWGLLEATLNGCVVGGAVVVANDSAVQMLEGRANLALLWDIRVAPERRGCGIGSALLRAAESWARTRQCRRLKVETQNINVPACRFYARHGFELRGVVRDAYPECPGEIQLLWYKGLSEMV